MKIYNPNGYKYVTVVEIPKSEVKKIDFETSSGDRDTVDSFYKKQKTKPAIVINGGFFNMSDGKPCFVFIDDGDIMSDDSAIPCGMGITASGDLIYTSNVGYRTDWRDFLSAYPPLVADGQCVSVNFATEIAYSARRSMLGYNDDAVFVVAVDQPGLTLKDAKYLMRDIGCTFAINLDGGGSTRLLHNGKLLTSNLYNRPVDNVVAIYTDDNVEEDEEDDVIYRVQAGAFCKKENAIAFRDTIRELPDTIGAGYKNARVVLVGGLYKVQIGAFSKKANASKVVTDLGRLGVTSFITNK